MEKKKWREEKMKRENKKKKNEKNVKWYIYSYCIIKYKYIIFT